MRLPQSLWPWQRLLNKSEFFVRLARVVNLGSCEDLFTMVQQPTEEDVNFFFFYFYPQSRRVLHSQGGSYTVKEGLEVTCACALYVNC